MTEIIPGLWMGGADDLDLVASKGITLVVNCTPDLPNIKGVSTKRIPVTDSSQTDRTEADQIMFSHLAETTRAIHMELGKGGAVLVHCFAGRQRSATVVAAYLIRYGKMPLGDVERDLQSKRPTAFSPYNNFRLALLRFEQMYHRAPARRIAPRRI